MTISKSYMQFDNPKIYFSIPKNLFGLMTSPLTSLCSERFEFRKINFDAWKDFFITDQIFQVIFDNFLEFHCRVINDFLRLVKSRPYIFIITVHSFFLSFEIGEYQDFMDSKNPWFWYSPRRVNGFTSTHRSLRNVGCCHRM